jgi:5-methylcytosine-specific restriction protein A
MGLESELSDRQAVLAAIAEFDQLGRSEFLQKYGFGRAGRFRLVHEGKQYDAKAIIGVARGVQFPDRGPLTSGDFASSAKAVKGTLERLGFQVQP